MKSLTVSVGWAAATLILCIASAAQRPGGSIHGKVVDGQGALVRGADIKMVSAIGAERTARSDQDGEFTIGGLPVGRYRLLVTSAGFASYEDPVVEIGTGKPVNREIKLSITVSENVTVGGEAPINTSPDANASAIVLSRDDLKALPDNPADLEAALQALAGPGAGPNGGDIYIDGFSGGRLPPRDSIREVRINQNPYSSEYDRPGFGRIEIFTKPGTEKWSGEVGSEFEDESANSRNPFAPNRPAFQLRNINGNIGGPLIKKRTSFFFDGEKEDIDNNSLINAVILSPGLVTTPFQRSVLSPLKTYEYSTRVDHQVNQNNTFSVRLLGSGSKTSNAGLGTFDLPTRAFTSRDSDMTLRLTDTAVVSPTIVDEASFQYIRRRARQTSSDNSPTIRVLDAFTSGGANVGSAFNNEERLEFQNFITVTRGQHLVRFGGRFRRVHILDSSPGNFAGTFTFTSIEQYRNTILHLTGARPSQFSIAGGQPAAQVIRMDVGVFIQDDWRLRPDLTVSAGIRYEVQSNISDHADFAPRVSLAYSPGAGGNRSPKTVFRAGFGIFYDRFSEGLTLQTLRFNGVNQQQFVVTDPIILGQPVFTADGRVANVPTIQQLTGFALPQTTRVVSPDLRAPRTTQFALSAERQLPLKTTLSVTVVHSSISRVLRSRNINAPVGGIRPIPGSGNIFQYEATGRFRQNQLLVNFKSNPHEMVSIFGNYALGSAQSDSDGAGTFPADQYDLGGEYGNSTVDIRHRFVEGGNIKAPFGISLSPFISFRSGVPFNITTGIDNNGDTLFTDRPAFATSPAELGIILTRFGAFDPTPDPGDTIIPRNFGRGPSFFITNLRIAREFGFGRQGSGSSKAPQGTKPDADEEESPYKLELSVQIRNLLNHTNGSTPIGNLSSPLFGQPVSLASGFGFGGGRQSGGNRRLRFEAKFSF